MFNSLRISQIITVLLSSILFLRYVGGNFHIINIGFPMGLIILLSIFHKVLLGKKIDNYLFELFVLSFLIYIYIGSYYSLASNYGQIKTFRLLLYMLLAVSSGRFVVVNFKLFLKANLIFFLLFFIAYFAFYGSFGSVLETLTPQHRLEMGGDTFKAIATSQYIGFNLISLFFFIFNLRLSLLLKNIIYTGLFGIGFFIMALFGSKGPILSLILAPLVYILFYKKMNIKKALVLLLAIIAISSIMLFPESIVKLIPQQYQAYFQSRFFNFEKYTDRTSLVQLAISDINVRSLLFGKGTGNYGFLYAGIDTNIYPHNIFIELLYENGILGLMLFLFFFIPLFNKPLHENSVNTKSSLIVFILYFLVGAQTSGDLANNATLFVFLILSFYHMKIEKKEFRLFQIISEFNKRKSGTLESQWKSG